MSAHGNPANLKYTKEHEWIRVEGEFGFIGISDFAQHALTDIVFVELPALGKSVEQFKQLCLVESVKSVSDIYAPVSGEVTETNKELETAAHLVNSDPYGKGWMAKLQIRNPAELSNLMSAAEYEAYLKIKSH
ncbi:MAG: glycine cleavage system protein GcvH [Candidatus Diapherotrites archaeon]|nr:glycine cleavage system protein GcvH [Candidatus Diapherotrites archaeon]